MNMYFVGAFRPCILMTEYIDLNKLWVPVHLSTRTRRANALGHGCASVSQHTGHPLLCSSLSLPVMTVWYTATSPFYTSSISELLAGQN